MAKRILVPIGPRDDHDTLLALIADVARSAGATVRLLHVMPPPDTQTQKYGRVISYASQEIEALEARGVAHLKSLSASLHGVPVEPSVRFGDVAEEILLEAAGFGAELIALRAQPRRWWRPFGLGGVARRVAARAAAPVMVLA